MKLLLVLAAIVAVALAATFGTLDPCGMLRESERKQDILAAILPNAIVDAAMVAKYGSLTPGRCIVNREIILQVTIIIEEEHVIGINL
jgi:hypothetical protein